MNSNLINSNFKSRSILNTTVNKKTISNISYKE